MPTFRFKSPDGKTYVVNGPDGATQDQAFQILQGQLASGQAKPVAAPTPEPTPTPEPQKRAPQIYPPRFGFMQGPLEAAAAMGTGMVAKPIADAATLGATAYEAVRGNKDFAPVDMQQWLQRQLTYEPRSHAGQVLAQDNPLALLGKGVDWVGSKVGGAIKGQAGADTARGMLGNAIHEAINQAPGLLGAKAGSMLERSLPERQATLDMQRSLDAPLQGLRERSQAAGLVVPPHGTSWLASIPGQSKFMKWLSSGNYWDKAPELAAQDLGLPKGVPITPTELEAIRQKYGGTYDRVAEAGNKMISPVAKPGTLGVPTTHKVRGFVADNEFRQQVRSDIASLSGLADQLPETFKADRGSIKLLRDYADKDAISGSATMAAIRKLRRDASVDFRSDDPAKITSAFTRQAVADHLENLVERNLAKSGDTKLLDEYRQQRAMTAKTYDIEAAMDGKGKINLRKLAAIGQKRPLSGNLKLLSDFANAYPEAAQAVDTKTAVSPWDVLFVGGTTVAGHPLLGAMDIAGKVGVPYAAKRGWLQGRAPTYQASQAYKLLPPTGAAISSQAGNEKASNP